MLILVLPWSIILLNAKPLHRFGVEYLNPGELHSILPEEAIVTKSLETASLVMIQPEFVYIKNLSLRSSSLYEACNYFIFLTSRIASDP